MQVLLMAVLVVTQAVSEDGVGRSIYEHGEIAGREVRAALRGDATVITGPLVACGRCHGAEAQGRSEAGVLIPPLRGPFSLSTVRRAVIDGVGRDGRPLHPSMPAYQMSIPELASLARYLQTLSAPPLAPGVTATHVRLGFVPGTRKDMARAVRSSIERQFTSVNAQGGIYGRRLELVDAVSPAAVDDILATVGSTGSDVASPAMPVIGPVAAVVPGAATFTLIPSEASQVKALVQYLLAAGLRRAVILRGDDVAGSDAAALVAAVSGVLAVRGVIRITGTALAVPPDDLDVAIFIGAESGLRDALRLVPPPIPIATLGIFAGRTAAMLPPADRDRILGAVPALLPPTDAGERSAAIVNDLPRTLPELFASASAAVLVEALKRSGHEVTRDRLVRALESFDGFKIPGFPAVFFGTARRCGLAGAFIVRYHSNRLEPLTSWISREACS